MLLIPFSHPDGRKRSASSSYKGGKRGNQRDNGKSNSNSRQRCRPHSFDMPYVNPVYDIIKNIDDLCDDGWNRHRHHQLWNTFRCESLLTLCLHLFLSPSPLLTWQLFYLFIL